MLIESDVVGAVCGFLSERGYAITQQLGPTQHGVDIIATRRDPEPRELWVEAKGETSERLGSQRYGKPFDSAQVGIHVAEAFYTAAKHVATANDASARVIAIALPGNELQRRYVAPIAPILARLGVVLLWVAPDKTVTVEPESAI